MNRTNPPTRAARGARRFAAKGLDATQPQRNVSGSEHASQAVRDALRLEGTARLVLEALVAADIRFSIPDLTSATNQEAPRAIEHLVRLGLIVRSDEREVGLAPEASDAVREIVVPSPSVWNRLLDLGQRRLAAFPGDPNVVLFAARTLAHAGHGRDALLVLERHVSGRSAMPSRELTSAIRDVVSADAAMAGSARALLARRQLRWGDVDGALCTLTGIETGGEAPDVARRIHRLRAAALLRAGQASVARGELDRAAAIEGAERDLALALARAELEIFRGRLRRARRRLAALKPVSRTDTALDARRLTLIALSYYLEDRFAAAVAFARRARGVRRLYDALPDPLGGGLEILALAGSGETARAVAVADELATDCRGLLGHAVATLFRATALARSVPLHDTLDAGEAGLLEIGQRGDRISECFACLPIGWAMLISGEVDRAEAVFQRVAAIVDDPGLLALRPAVERCLAWVARVRGNIEECRARLRRAYELQPTSAVIRFETWAMAAVPDMPEPRADDLPAPMAALAYARMAERALEERRPTVALICTDRAEALSQRSGLPHDAAYVSFVRAQALLDLGELSLARQAISACETLAGKVGPVLLRVPAALVRAAIADRSGDLACYVASIAQVQRLACDFLVDDGLRKACTRVGLTLEDSPRSGTRPLEFDVSRLGLDRPVDAIWQIGSSVYLLAHDERPQDEFDLLVDLVDRKLEGHRFQHDARRQPKLLRLCALLGEIPEGVGPEEAYLAAWEAVQYHPLRHRNTVYVAVGRLRKLLRKLFGREVIAESAEGRYQLTAGLRVAVRCDAASHWPGSTAPAAKRRRDVPRAVALWHAALGTAARQTPPTLLH
jgi:tetratricopeptide (TPR) repeat protein